MNIKFIYPDLNKDINWKGCYYEGIGSIMTVLKHEGHNVSLLHVIKFIDDSELFDFIGNDTDLLAFSTTTNMFPLVKKWSALIKKKFPDLPLLCGGNHPTIAPAETLTQSCVDWCCIGEGESFVVDLCEAMSHEKRVEDIPNLAYKKNSEVIINPTRPLIVNIDSIPIVDRTFFSDNISKTGTPHVFASRGCPFNCSYCCNKAKKDIYPNSSNYLRFHSPVRVIEEIKKLLELNSKIKSIEFIDDVFASNIYWLEEFQILYKTHIKIPFMCAAHPDYLNARIIEILADMGCRQINIGLQSGDEHIRKIVMNRNMSLNRIFDAVDICRKNNIATKVDVIFGVPTETKTQMMTTLDVLARLNADEVKSHIFYPYPYTELGHISKKLRLLEGESFGEDYHSGTILKYGPTKRRTILFMHLFAAQQVKALKAIYNSPAFSRRAAMFLFKVILSNVIINITILSRDFIKGIISWHRMKNGVREFLFDSENLSS